MIKSSFKSDNIRRTVVFNGKDVAITLGAAEWAAWTALVASRGHTVAATLKGWRLNSRDAIVPAILDDLKQAGAVVFKYATREQWLGAIVDAMRSEFKARGYPLPEKVVAVMGFPSTGWRGKRQGECWTRTASADKQTSHIFIHPCVTDIERIVNILTHELCHSAQDMLAELRDKPKQASGHGKFWKEVSEAMDVNVGKGTHALGDPEGAWGAWAKPLIEAAGPMPYAALDAYVPKEKKQTTRMLKLEHKEGEGGCGAVWRMSLTHIADKPTLSCPCCAAKIANPHFGEGDDSEEPDAVPLEQQRPTRKPTAEEADTREEDEMLFGPDQPILQAMERRAVERGNMLRDVAKIAGKPKRRR